MFGVDFPIFTPFPKTSQPERLRSDLETAEGAAQECGGVEEGEEVGGNVLFGVQVVFLL